MSDYSMLLSPFQVGKLTLKNRIISAPTSLAELGPGDTFSPENIAFFEQKAKGGCSLVSVGDCIAHGRTGIDHPSIVVLDDRKSIPSMKALTDAVHKYGAYAAVEFGHGGKRSNPAFLPSGMPIGPCDIFDADGKMITRGMDRALMEEVKAGYYNSAVNCAEAGFDVLTIHLGHGWLLGQFLSPLSNHREDEYGGSPENRCRYVIEILQAVRRGAPDCVIDVRISGSELTKKGYDLAGGVELCRILEPWVDMFNISAGVMEDLFTWIIMHPSMFVPDGCNVYLAEAVKKAVNKPVSCVGAIGNPDMMEEILKSDKADLIALGRGLIADPELPNKVMGDRKDEIRRCLRCFSCQGNMMKDGKILCSVNPVIGQEKAVSEYPAPQKKLRIAVVGGGPGGMQAAITAAQRGHSVTLYEKTDSLGGALKFAEHEDFKGLLWAFACWQKKQLEKLGVAVRLNTPVTAEALDKMDIDAVICAVGADPITPDRFGIPGNNYVLGTELFAPGVEIGKNVVIMGGGLVGCETGLHLAEEGRAVTIIEMAPEIAQETTAAHRRAMKVRMGLHRDMAGGDNVKPTTIPPRLQTSTKCLRITDTGVIARLPDGSEQLFPADTVICALGLRPRSGLLEELKTCRHPIYAVGDCLKARQVTQAVREGFDAAMQLGL